MSTRSSRGKPYRSTHGYSANFNFAYLIENSCSWGRWPSLPTLLTAAGGTYGQLLARAPSMPPVRMSPTGRLLHKLYYKRSIYDIPLTVPSLGRPQFPCSRFAWTCPIPNRRSLCSASGSPDPACSPYSACSGRPWPPNWTQPSRFGADLRVTASLVTMVVMGIVVFFSSTPAPSRAVAASRTIATLVRRPPEACRKNSFNPRNWLRSAN